MVNEKLLSRSDIVKECGISYYERGRQYYADGAVLQCKVTSEGALFTQLNAAVEGSANSPYKLNIRITWRPGFKSAEIEGSCSCPIGYNCKHVVAVCLAYQDGNKEGERKRQESGCLEWLDSFNRQVKTVDKDNAGEFIAYILKPTQKVNELTVELLVTKEKKYGGLSKGRKTSLQNLRYSFSHYGFVTPEDSEIVKLITALDTTFGAEPLISGSLGAIALIKLLQTGRLYWQDIEMPPLRPGALRDLKFDWQLTVQNDYQLHTMIEPAAVPVLVDPPHYIDPDEGVIGRFSAASLNYQQLKAILAAPPVPEKVADEFSYRLTVEYPELDLPPPKKIDVKEITGIEPVPHLILYGEQSLARHYVHYIAVGFKYGQWLLPGKEAKDYSVINTPQGLVRIKRFPEKEKATILRLSELGFSPAPGTESTGKEFILGSYAKSTIESASRWGHLLESVVPELEQEGWLIEFRDSFLLNFQAVDNWDAEISDSQNDWFEMRFNIEVEGQSIPLLPLIMPVLENYDLNNLPELLNIPVSDYRFLTVPSEKIKPFLAILLELFGGSTFDKNGSLKISRFNAASLADMETHSYGLFSIKGGEEIKKLAKKLADFKGIDDVPVPYNLRATLREYQKLGLNWLQFLREYAFAGILADDMGLGKTVQTLAHLLLEKQSGRMKEPSLIIAPTSLLSNWRRESERFTPDLNMLILQGTERKQLFYKMRDYDVIMTTYPLLPRDEETLLEHQYHYLILDEAQIIKNPLSKGAQIVRQINSRHRLCLTGTPMENHLGELWAQFDFLMPGFLGDSATFKRLYRTPIETFGNADQKARLSKRIAPFMLRRTKQEVAAELPPKTEIIRSVPLYEKQAALYESIRLTMEKKVRDAIAERGLSRSHITILDALLKLRQTCCDPRTLPLDAAQKINESAKLDLLMELLPELLEEGRKILVFSQFTRMIALIEDKLNHQGIAYSKLTGQTKDRDAAIGMFKNGEVDVFLISLKAGGIGLNLTEADTVIIYDPWWNPAVENQAADRAHRIGQDKPVFVYKLITENTVEEKMLAMQDRKRALADSIYNEGAKEEALQLTADDLTALFQPL
ncbi:MAG: DEAD/DEAH box helicase family protein [Methylococcaceae bacterium]|nr:DEAD/DEAH box helicase family protein [Methylococcaceae bacterium]